MVCSLDQVQSHLFKACKALFFLTKSSFIFFCHLATSSLIPHHSKYAITGTNLFSNLAPTKHCFSSHSFICCSIISARGTTSPAAYFTTDSSMPLHLISPLTVLSIYIPKRLSATACKLYLIFLGSQPKCNICSAIIVSHTLVGTIPYL